MPQPPPTLQPVAEAPPPKEVPWWGALILAVVVSIVTAVGTAYYMDGRLHPSPTPAGVTALYTDTIVYLPHILILFGVFADIFTLQGAYSIPSLVGLCSIPLNYLMSFFWDGIATIIGSAWTIITTGSAPTATAVVSATLASAGAPMRGCEISGFESIPSPYAPQSLVVTATIFWYYLLDLLMNRDPLDSSVTWIAFIVFFGLQAMQLKDCSNMAGSVAIKTFISLAEGFVIGGTGYGIVQSTIPTRLPSAVLPQGPSINSLTKQADGSYTDSSGKEYIVGPDGRPVPKSFLAAAAEAAGPATQTRCSA